MTAIDDSASATHSLRPTTARWTHIALRVSDIDATIAWYQEFTTLELLDKREDEDGYGAWLGHSDAGEFPFVLVLAQFFEGRDPFAPTPLAKMAPFNHFGIELPNKADVDEIAARGAAAGCLAMPARQMPDPIGYICFLEDPDGNLVEFSFDQGVYEKVREVWG
ncbi:MAG: VOC family protein [Ilumatobacter sp.]|jgi:lactoylglutathione lyase|uniref:VOC family protein n=1 Tax=Ilumatobacter sp. TaxID=1967498 RepID=UPI00391BBDC5